MPDPEYLTWQLPVADGGPPLAFSAENRGLTARLARFFGQIMQLELNVAAAPHPGSSVILTRYDAAAGETAVPWQEMNGPVPFPGRVLYDPLHHKARIEVREGECIRNLAVLFCRRTLCLGVISGILTGRTLTMLHGGLLQMPGTGDGVVLFGESGVGKTAACRRFRTHGGTVLSDDKVLLSLNKDGLLQAQGLPSWSNWRFANDPAARPVDSARALPVRAILRVERGESDRIIPLDPLLWRTALTDALSCHYLRPSRYLTAALQKETLIRVLDWLPRLRLFGSYSLQGDLRGNPMQSIGNFLYRK